MVKKKRKMWNIYLAGVIIFFTNQIFFLFFFLDSAPLLLLCSPFVFYFSNSTTRCVFPSNRRACPQFSKNVFLRDVIKTFQDYPMTMSRQTMMTGWTKVQVPPLPLLHLEPQYILPNKVLQKIGKNQKSLKN